MSPLSPLTSDSTLSLKITASAKAVDDTLQVVSVDTWHSVNKVPRARIVLFDGDLAERTFAVSSAATFQPGAAIDVFAGYDATLTSIFSGIVTGHSIEIPRAAASTLVVELADAAIGMAVERHTVIWENRTDSYVMAALLADAGLENDVTETAVRHEAIVQFDATDWDMLLTCAEANGMLVMTDAGKVHVTVPDTSAEAVLQVEYGESLIELRAEIDALARNAAAARANTWGKVSFQGSALAKTGTMLALAGVGDRFNGKVFISGVHHRISDGSWLTTVDFGLPVGWHRRQRSSAIAHPGLQQSH